MTKLVPGFAGALAGRWRIAKMEEWEDLDLLESAHVTFSGRDGGKLVVLAIEANLDVGVSVARCGREASPGA